MGGAMRDGRGFKNKAMMTKEFNVTDAHIGPPYWTTQETD